MKNELRKEFKKKRANMDKEEVVEKSIKACKVFLESDFYKKSQIIMLYMPLGNELDTTDIINRAFKDGKKLVFPVTDEDTGAITPCYATEESEFEKGGFSVSEPCDKNVANVKDIDVVIVPGIVFGENGSRIGFGKGCYDMFLKKTTATKIGFCYENQLAEHIPGEIYDIKMDYIITEKGLRTCENM